MTIGSNPFAAFLELLEGTTDFLKRSRSCAQTVAVNEYAFHLVIVGSILDGRNQGVQAKSIRHFTSHQRHQVNRFIATTFSDLGSQINLEDRVFGDTDSLLAATHGAHHTDAHHHRSENEKQECQKRSNKRATHDKDKFLHHNDIVFYVFIVLIDLLSKCCRKMAT